MSGTSRIVEVASSSQEEASIKTRLTRQRLSSTSTPSKNPVPSASTPISKTGSDYQASAKIGKMPGVEGSQGEDEEVCEEAYVSQFLESGMLDDMAREQSQIYQCHLEHTVMVAQLEEKMEQLLAPGNVENCKKEMIDLLISASDVGDTGVKAASRIREISDDKLFNLDLAARDLDKVQRKKDPPKKSAKISMLSSPYSGSGKDDPSKKSSQESNDSGINVERTSAEGSSSGSPEQGPSQAQSLDANSVDTGYRACKFRNTPNYAGMCVVKKKNKRQGSVRRGARDLSSDEDGEEGDEPVLLGSTSVPDNGNGYNTPPPIPIPIYCICRKVSYGRMVECDGDKCPMEWFHFGCVGMKKAPREGIKWYCPNCRAENNSTKKKQTPVLGKEAEKIKKKKEEEEAK